MLEGKYRYNPNFYDRGPVMYKGCRQSVIDWLPPYLKAIGVIALGLGICQLFALVMGYLMYKATSVKHIDKAKRKHPLIL